MSSDSVRSYRRLERQHPIFSPVALISTLILAVGLGVGVTTTGGRAFSPGELSAVNHSGLSLDGVLNHAQILDDCGQCHEPFQGIAADRCQRCHTDIRAQREEEDGLHGRLDNVTACDSCHLEHRGETYDLKTAAVADFDHDLTRFSLARHALDYEGKELRCAACHLEEGVFAPDNNGCETCHRQENGEFLKQHEKAFGVDCVACHDGQDTLTDFTLEQHMEIFVLDGAHLTANCERCHAGGQFSDLAHDCAACHQEPKLHLGMFDADCAACHLTAAWTPAVFEGFAFDHELSTSFSLERHRTDFDGAPFSCTTCHLPGEPTALSDDRCIACHQPAQPEFIPAHSAEFGLKCQSCHDGRGNMSNFDHNLVWPLEGTHLQIECNSCHGDQVFRGTPRECVACHEEPQIHMGIFGLTCQYCHTSADWLPARLRMHTFPLDHGGQGALECVACHQSAAYTEYTCTTCHEHEPVQMETAHEFVDTTGVGLPACAACHPSGHLDD